MKPFLQNLAALVKVKTLITATVTAVFAVLALRGSLSPEHVMCVITTVTAFYFGTQHEQHKP